MKPPILIYDIETAPAIGLFFGKPWDVNIAKIIQHEYIFGFAYGWIDHDKNKIGKIQTCYAWDFPQYHKRIKPKGRTLAAFLEAEDQRISATSKEVLKIWSSLVTEAQIIGGQNSDQFDYKHMFGRLPMYDLPPIPKPQTIDTKKMAKQIGNYPSNKLDDLGERFGTGRKLAHTGYPNAIDLWWDCMNDVEKAQRHMVKYNKIDVVRTADLYLKLRPYAPSHPNIANIAGRPDACPKCGVEGFLMAQGVRYTKTGQYRRFQCKSCGSYVSNRQQEKGERPQYV